MDGFYEGAECPRLPVGAVSVTVMFFSHLVHSNEAATCLFF